MAFDHCALVRRAAKMVAVEMACTIDDALRLMRAGAEIAGVSLDDVAAAVLDGSIDFTDPVD
ncbi:MAG: hypothetical protein QOI44_1768 [Actinomycetota bacterium]|nr:hypothetical protein [Actinomycetota bacterium]